MMFPAATMVMAGSMFRELEAEVLVIGHSATVARKLVGEPLATQK